MATVSPTKPEIIVKDEEALPPRKRCEHCERPCPADLILECKYCRRAICPKCYDAQRRVFR